MALRLSRTPRPLFSQVAAVLQLLGVLGAVGGNPTAFGLIAVDVTGLVLLDARPTQPRIGATLPTRCHNALNRLLRVLPLTRRALMTGLLWFARQVSRRLGTPGHLGVAVKARWQGEVLRNGRAMPGPVRTAPPEFRVK